MSDNTDDLEPLNVAPPGPGPSPFGTPPAAPPPPADMGPQWWATPPDAGAPPPNKTNATDGARRALVAAVVVLAMVFAGIGGYALTSHIKDNNDKSNSATDTPRRAPNAVPPPQSTDKDASTLNNLGLRQQDLAANYGIALLPNGNTLKEATLDLCNGTFASEKLRTARKQVAEVENDGNSTVWLSTEAVLYRDDNAVTQAFNELRDVAAHCPNKPVPSPTGGQTMTTTINAPPDRKWKKVGGVERLAYDTTMVSQAGNRLHNVAVYLRRGRVFLGVYFAKPDGAQPPVAGQKTIESIVHEFEQRLAAINPSVVNGAAQQRG